MEPLGVVFGRDLPRIRIGAPSRKSSRAPSGCKASPGVVLGRARIYQYKRSLRPCLARFSRTGASSDFRDGAPVTALRLDSVSVVLDGTPVPQAVSASVDEGEWIAWIAPPPAGR